MDCIITNAVEGNRKNRKENIFIERYMKKVLIREVFEDKVLQYLENSEPEKIPGYIKLCEDLGFVENKIKILLGFDKFDCNVVIKGR